MNAEELLDTAEKDFDESAFSPFWDAIERAVNELGEASSSLTHIEKSASRYKELAGASDKTPPEFPVEPDAAQRLIVADVTGERLKQIVRTAQRNFQFATIYEQRKTNQILVAGFDNLGDAIVGLGDHISDSIRAVGDRVDDVTRSVRDMDTNLQEAHREAQQAQRDFQEALSEQHKQEMKAQGERDSAQAKQAKEALEMLDNIQRGRKPRF